jgi:hypothetical protein
MRCRSTCRSPAPPATPAMHGHHRAPYGIHAPHAQHHRFTRSVRSHARMCRTRQCDRIARQPHLIAKAELRERRAPPLRRQVVPRADRLPQRAARLEHAERVGERIGLAARHLPSGITDGSGDQNCGSDSCGDNRQWPVQPVEQGVLWILCAAHERTTAQSTIVAQSCGCHEATVTTIIIIR